MLRSTIIGAPVDSGVITRPGARFGPAAIRAALAGFSLSDEPEYDPEAGIATVSAASFQDAGDAVAVTGDHRRSLLNVRDKCRAHRDDTGFLVLLGGDHSVTVPAVSVLAERDPDFDFLFVDAHLDFAEAVQGVADTHASTAFAVSRLIGGRLVQVGYRNVATSSHDSLRRFLAGGHLLVGDRELSTEAGRQRLLSAIAGRRIYLSVDLDGLNPAEAPAVSTPSPGGLSFAELKWLVGDLVAAGSLIGLDVVECAPPYDLNGMTAFLAAQLILEVQSKRQAAARG